MRKSKVSLLAFVICFSIMLMFSGSAVAFANSYSNEEANSVVLNQIAVYDSAAKNAKLLKIVQAHIDTNMEGNGNRTIKRVKNLYDFDGNMFTLFELNPIGYIVYHGESGKFIEYAENSPSPYLDVDGKLYYGGPMQYYRTEIDHLIGTLKTDVIITKADIQLLAPESRKMKNSINENRNYNVLSYIDGEITKMPSVAILEEKQNDNTIMSTPSVAMTTFFPRLQYSWQMGYVGKGGGVCGYIAANLMLGYSYFAYDGGLLNSYYANSDQTMNSWNLTRRLLELNGIDPDGTEFPGTTATGMKDVVYAFLLERPNWLGWEVAWSISSVWVKEHINNNHPVALFGNWPDVSASGNVNHAIVAYGHRKCGFLNLDTEYRVHYGWSGYSDVRITSGITGTTLYLKTI